MDGCMSQVAENIHLWLQLGRRPKGKTTEWTILSESYNKACHIRATMLLVAALPCNKDEDNHKIQEWQRESSPEPVRIMEGIWKTRLCTQYVLYCMDCAPVWDTWLSQALYTKSAAVQHQTAIFVVGLTSVQCCRYEWS